MVSCTVLLSLYLSGLLFTSAGSTFLLFIYLSSFRLKFTRVLLRKIEKHKTKEDYKLALKIPSFLFSSTSVEFYLKENENFMTEIRLLKSRKHRWIVIEGNKLA